MLGCGDIDLWPVDQEIKKRWIEALRSGRYEQGKSCLAREQPEGGEIAFCCLGVLCELSVEEGVAVRERVNGDRICYNGSICHLPAEVRDWALVSSSQAAYFDPADVALHCPDVVTSRRHATLADLNDSGASFRQIADLIEAKL